MTARPAAVPSMTGDAAWNFGALAATAGSGAVLTLLIAGRMGPAALGVFAQLYAVHVIGTQIAVLGVHDSTQKHVAELDGVGPDAPIVRGAIQVAVTASVALAVLLALLAPVIGAAIDSDDVARGLVLVAPGIVAFAINKVLFATLNGRGRLRRYAHMQLLRAALVLTAGAMVAATRWPAFAVGGIFTAAELALLPCLAAAVRQGPPVGGDAPSRGKPAWWRLHLGFGGRGLVNAILLETHLRVDVVTLSLFVSDRAVGVYAFAALFAEGIYQVPVVIRTVAYPTVVRLASRRDRGSVVVLARRLAVASGGLSLAASLAVLLAYPWIAGAFDPEFSDLGLPVLRILLAGIVVYACLVPVDQLLLQSGFPGRQSVLMALYVGVNVVLNLALIPVLGVVGAAIATAIAFVAAGTLLLAASWVWLGYRGGVLFARRTAA